MGTVGQARMCVRGAVALGLVLAGMQLASSPHALALDPALDVSQYGHTAWRIPDGFTKGAIRSIAQTADGYLWLGTESGLVRFDGVKAVPWQPPTGEQLPSNDIRKLLVARDGTLWIGTLKGLASWKDGKLTQYPEVAGRTGTGSLLQDREGTIWAGEWQEPQGRLCAIRNGAVECYGTDGSLGWGALALYEDSKSNLWVASTGGLWHWKPGIPKFYALPSLVYSVAEDADGALLLGADGRMWRFVNGQIAERGYPLPDSARGAVVSRMLKDQNGALWIGMSPNGGLLHAYNGRIDTFAQLDGLSGGSVLALFQDREGNFWVATPDGLDRFRNIAIPTSSARQGLPLALGSAVLAASDGSIWVGLGKGLGRLNQDQVTIYRQRPQREVPIAGRIVHETIDSRLPQDYFSAFFRDHSGRLLISWGGGVGYLENDKLQSVNRFGTRWVLSIAEDASGDLWLSAQEDGLLRLHDGRFVQKIPWDGLGLKGRGGKLVFDRVRGGFWIGFLNGGVGFLQDGQLRASYSPADGFGEGAVNDLRVGPRGTLWAATDGGLSRIKDGHITTLTSKNGLPCDLVHWSIEDEDHFVWLRTSCGLVRIARSELDAWASDPEQKVQLTVFGAQDGVRTVASYVGFDPQVTKAPDGRIWFATVGGVSVIDPRHIPYNKLPPPVHVEQITADGKVHDVASTASGRMRLPPLVRDLTIDYTALSLAVPEKVHFRFKLEGQDKDWREVVNNRQVQYSNLKPRNYRFLVTACNNSGVWNEEGAFLDFSIDPAYYQTTWFRSLCVAAVLALLWAVYQVRLRQVAREFNLRLDERVNERTRIARELHDTLLQSFHGSLLRFQAVSNELVEGEPKQELDEAIDRAAQAITEGRDAVQGLRSSVVESNDLAAALGTLGKELAAAESQPPEFTLQVEGTQRGLHPILRDEVYRVAGEALRNAFRHADARRIEVEIRYDERQFRLRVRDDGKGIDPKLLAEGGQAGHFGLRGMRERAKQVGAKLTVWSSDPQTDGGLESGTEIELSIPAARAYVAVRSPGRRSWLAEKFSGKEHEMKS